MDYEVFLMSVREEYRKTGDNRHRVAAGISTTARVITDAAITMVSVSFLISHRESDEQRL